MQLPGSNRSIWEAKVFIRGENMKLKLRERNGGERILIVEPNPVRGGLQVFLHSTGNWVNILDPQSNYAAYIEWLLNYNNGTYANIFILED